MTSTATSTSTATTATAPAPTINAEQVDDNANDTIDRVLIDTNDNQNQNQNQNAKNAQNPELDIDDEDMKADFDDYSDSDSDSVSSTDSDERLARTRVADSDPRWIDVTHDQGVRKLVLCAGWGPPCPDGGDVFIKYVSRFSQSQKTFEDTRGNAYPFKFLLGHFRVIRAWDITVAGMRLGERALIRSTARYAWGEKGEGRKIPPNIDCDFEIEVCDWFDWKRVDNKDEVRKRILTPGEGDLYDVPDNSSICDLTYVCQLFEAKYPEAVVSRGRHTDVIVNDDPLFPDGFHEALKTMNKYEVAEFKIDGASDEYSFGADGRPELGIGPQQSLYYRVHLHNYQSLMSRWKMEPEQLFDVAKRFKAKAELYFKAGNLEIAFERYEKSMHYWQAKDRFNEEQLLYARAQEALIRGNLALIHLKRKEYKDCIRECGKVLEYWPKNVKAFARRGHARMMMCSYRSAKKNIKKALSIDPSHVYARKLRKMNRAKKKQYFKRQRELYGGMFDKYNQHQLQRKRKKKKKKLSQKEMEKPENQERWIGNDDDEHKLSGDEMSEDSRAYTDTESEMGSEVSNISFDDLSDDEVETHPDSQQVIAKPRDDKNNNNNNDGDRKSGSESERSENSDISEIQQQKKLQAEADQDAEEEEFDVD